MLQQTQGVLHQRVGEFNGDAVSGRSFYDHPHHDVAPQNQFARVEVAFFGEVFL